MMRKFNVLLVEDTKLLAEMVMDTLKQIPEVETYHTATGDAAVAFLESVKPDLMMLDLNLPGRSGWQVLEFVKGKYGSGKVKVIVMTAQSDGANKLVGMLQEVDQYLIKPVPPREILAIVRETLDISTT